MRHAVIPRKPLLPAMKPVRIVAVLAMVAIFGGHAHALPLTADFSGGPDGGRSVPGVETTINADKPGTCALIGGMSPPAWVHGIPGWGWTNRVVDTVLASNIGCQLVRHSARAAGPEGGVILGAGMMIGVVLLKRRMGK